MDYETKASEQVPLYMQMKNPDLALKKAIESGDSDLSICCFSYQNLILKRVFFSVYMVLLSSKDKFNNISDFMKEISKNHVAMSLMLQVRMFLFLKLRIILTLINYKLKYYRQNDINKLCDIFDQENMGVDHALTLTKVAYKQEVRK